MAKNIPVKLEVGGSLSQNSEAVLGEFPVVTSLAMGNEHLRVFVTDRRMVFAYVGKRGGAALAGVSFLGLLSGAVEDLVKSGKESVGRERLEQIVPEKVLMASKDNFAVGYDEVVQVELFETPRFTLITMVTRDEKMEFRSVRKFDVVHDLLGPKLAGKIKTVRLEG